MKAGLGRPTESAHSDALPRLLVGTALEGSKSDGKLT